MVQDLQVLLNCILYHFDKEINKGYVLYNRHTPCKHAATKQRIFNMEKKTDFCQFYLLVQHMRVHLIKTEQYLKQSKLDKSMYMAVMGFKDPPKNKKNLRVYNSYNLADKLRLNQTVNTTSKEKVYAKLNLKDKRHQSLSNLVSSAKKTKKKVG